jgi:ABC-type nitrate/sulfonate/bicarbonate transport system substrate-binding protein
MARLGVMNIFASGNRGISSAVLVAIVVVVIIAVAGWGVYFVAPVTKTTTVASTVTGSTVISTVTGPTVTQTPTYVQPTTSTASFSVGIVPYVVPQIGEVGYYGPASGIFSTIIPGATFPSVASSAVAADFASNSVQMMVGAAAAFIPALAAGAPIQLVAVLDPDGVGIEIEVAGNSPYTSPLQLKGQTIATSSLTGQPWLNTVLPFALCCNFTANTDYSVLNVDGSGATQDATVLAGKAAAATLGVLTNYALNENGTMKSLGNYTEPIPEAELWANTNFIKSNPQAVAATVYAFTQMAKSWDNNENAAIANLIKSYLYTKPEALYAYSSMTFSTSGAISVSAQQLAVNTCLEYGLISSNITATSFINTQFAPLVS